MLTGFVFLGKRSRDKEVDVTLRAYVNRRRVVRPSLDALKSGVFLFARG